MVYVIKMGLKEKVMNRESQISKKLRLICELNKPNADVDRQWRLLGEAEDNLYEMMDLYDELINEQDLERDVMAVLHNKVRINEDYDTKMS